MHQTEHKQWQTLFLLSQVNCKLCNENKGMLESLLSTDTVYPEIEFSQRMLLKVLCVPLR